MIDIDNHFTVLWAMAMVDQMFYFAIFSINYVTIDEFFAMFWINILVAHNVLI